MVIELLLQYLFAGFIAISIFLLVYALIKEIISDIKYYINKWK